MADAQAEWLLGAMAGISADTLAPALGVRAGYYGERHRFIGLEISGYRTRYELSDKRPATTSVALLSGGAVTVTSVPTGNKIKTRADAWMTTADLVLRYPGERWQPYIGGGLGAVISKLDQPSESVTSLATELIGGVRWSVLSRAAVYGEFRYVRTHPQFSRPEAVAFNSSQDLGIVAAGIVWTFQP